MDAPDWATRYDLATLFVAVTLGVVWVLYPVEPVRIVLVLVGFTVFMAWGAFALKRALFRDRA